MGMLLVHVSIRAKDCSHVDFVFGRELLLNRLPRDIFRRRRHLDEEAEKGINCNREIAPSAGESFVKAIPLLTFAHHAECSGPHSPRAQHNHQISLPSIFWAHVESIFNCIASQREEYVGRYRIVGKSGELSMERGRKGQASFDIVRRVSRHGK